MREATTSNQAIRAAGRPEGMTVEELLSLPVAVDLVTAGLAFGISKNSAYGLAKRDQFPCRVLKLGNQYRVPRADILRALGVTETPLENTA
jgi:hypothetical protein